jgi:hypothetical protein
LVECRSKILKNSFVERGLVTGRNHKAVIQNIDNCFIFSFSGLKTVAFRGLKNMKNYGS